MGDFLTEPFQEGTKIAPWPIVARLLAAVVLGWIVSWIYRRTLHKSAEEGSLPATLVLLAVLIAMTTQVIGNSVARAFSLVGALSIVRFRTVVRDTRDTAFVIFAVVVGMAVGAQQLWIAGLGTLVVGAAAYLMFLRNRNGANGDFEYLLRIRAGLDNDLEKLAADNLGPDCKWQLLAIDTAKQGTLREATFGVTLDPGRRAGELVTALHNVSGVQDVRLVRRGFEEV